MSVNVVKVESGKQLKTFIRFNYELYKGNEFFVPELYEDTINTSNNIYNLKKNHQILFIPNWRIRQITKQYRDDVFY